MATDPNTTARSPYVRTADPRVRFSPAALAWVRVVEPLETLLTALMLAFVFRAFFIEAFIIPTGSMAPGLCGRHATLLCPDCGTEFDFGLPEQAEIPGAAHQAAAHCPSCRRAVEIRPGDERAGDRILVHKWLTWAWPGAGLSRWDAIVFRDPADPRQHYIKRLVGLPGEAVEILDGDVFVTPAGGAAPQIARKPRSVQDAIWIPVHDQRLIPAGSDARQALAIWTAEPAEPPLHEQGGLAGWIGLAERVLRFVPAQEHRFSLRFDPQGAVDFRQDFYAYNDGASGAFYGDVRLSADALLQSEQAQLELHLLRDAAEFVATLSGDGRATLRLTDHESGAVIPLGGGRWRSVRPGRPVRIELAHADWRAELRVEGRVFAQTSDAQWRPDVNRLRQRRRTAAAQLRLVAWGGELSLRHLQIDRDVCYTLTVGTLRARPSEPFVLPTGSYFVLGDNSPRSHDGREWVAVAPELRRDRPYPAGTVRVDQIVGRAFFVYLPGWMSWDSAGRWRLPDMGRMRFIR